MAEKKKVRILSLDGGGMRGIIPATIIKHVEEYLEEKKPGTTIADHFDLIAGTSTGGILTAIYLTPGEDDPQKAKYTASDALDFYVKEGYNIFNASKVSGWRRWGGLANSTSYHPCNLENLLKKNFGDTMMSQLIKPCLITTYNMNSKSSYFFTSQEDKTKREFLVRDVLRSTSAAPTYFPPAKIKNIAPNANQEDIPIEMMNLDGGVFANNPTMCAYAEARNTNFKTRNNPNPYASHMYILSIGTGGGRFKIDKKEKSHKWSLLKWAKHIPDIMMDASIDTVAFQMEEIKKTLEESDPGDYLRIDVAPNEPVIYAAEMSDASSENINNLLKTGEKVLDKAIEDGLNDFLDKLE